VTPVLVVGLAIPLVVFHMALKRQAKPE